MAFRGGMQPGPTVEEPGNKPSASFLSLSKLLLLLPTGRTNQKPESKGIHMIQSVDKKKRQSVYLQEQRRISSPVLGSLEWEGCCRHSADV